MDSAVVSLLSEASYSIIISEQHGFTKGRSTLTNLMMFINYITKAIDNALQVDAVYLDFSKAFDAVNHSLLLEKF